MVFGQVGVRYIEHLMVLKIKPSTDGCNTVVLEVGGWIGWYPGRGRYRFWELERPPPPYLKCFSIYRFKNY